MIHVNRTASIYNYLAPLMVSVISLFSIIYLGVLETDIYMYFVPLCSLSFLISLVLFYRVKREVKENESTIIHSFYHRAFGIFAFTFFLFASLTLVYLPFYHDGGSLYVCCYAPVGILSLIACMTAKHEMKKK